MIKKISKHLFLLSGSMFLLFYIFVFLFLFSLFVLSDGSVEPFNTILLCSLIVGSLIFLFGLLIFLIDIYRRKKAKRKFGIGFYINVLLVMPFFLLLVYYLHYLFSLPKEVQGICPVKAQGTTQIFYQDKNGNQNVDFVTDEKGQGQRIIVENDYPNSIHRNPRNLSPDGSMLIYPFGNDLWIKCINSNSNFKIFFPSTHRTQTTDASGDTFILKSYPSWSPDSKKLVFNYDGDLIIFDVVTHATSIFKPQISLHDNHLNLSDPNQKNRAPLEIGDAIWLGNNKILYTAFQQNPVTVHSYDVSTGNDIVLKTFNHPVDFLTASPDGKWLIVREDPWSWPYDETIISHYGESYLVNLENGWQDTNSLFFKYTQSDSYGTSIYWSPNSDFFAVDNSDYVITDSHQQPAPIVPLNAQTESDVIDIVAGVKRALQVYGINLNENVTVGIEGFLPNKSVVISVRQSDNFLIILNGIYSFETGELHVLQNYRQNQTSQLLPFAIAN